jgi:hypothetical protein
MEFLPAFSMTVLTKLLFSQRSSEENIQYRILFLVINLPVTRLAPGLYTLLNRLQAHALLWQTV